MTQRTRMCNFWTGNGRLTRPILRVTIIKHESRTNVRNDERTWIYNARSQAEIETFDTRGGTIKR